MFKEGMNRSFFYNRSGLNGTYFERQGIYGSSTITITTTNERG